MAMRLISLVSFVPLSEWRLACDVFDDDDAKAKNAEEALARVGTREKDGAGTNYVSEFKENLVCFPSFSI